MSHPISAGRDKLSFGEFEDVNKCFVEWKQSLKDMKVNMQFLRALLS